MSKQEAQEGGMGRVVVIIVVLIQLCDSSNNNNNDNSVNNNSSRFNSTNGDRLGCRLRLHRRRVERQGPQEPGADGGQVPRARR